MLLPVAILAATNLQRIPVWKRRRPREVHKRRAVGPRTTSRVVSSQPITSCADIVYYGDVAIGGQTAQVIFDTGSSDFWVASTLCGNSCNGLDRYNSSQSPAYEPDGRAFSISYADGDHVSGTWAYDTLTWAGLDVPHTGFAEISAMGAFAVCGQEDGLLGMAFQSVSQLNEPPPFDVLVGTGQLDAGVFAFHVPSDNDDVPGELTLGGVDPAHYEGELGWAPVVGNSGYWQISVSSVKIGTTVLDPNLHAPTAIVDTGTSYIVTRKAVLWDIAAAIGATCFVFSEAYQGYTIQRCSDFATSTTFDFVVAPCNTTGADLEFEFQGIDGVVAVTVPTSYYLSGEECAFNEFRDCNGLCFPDAFLVWNTRPDGECDSGEAGINFNCPRWHCDYFCDPCGNDATVDMCFVGIQGDNAANYFWLLGDTFLSSTYAAFDSQTRMVGLAPTRKNVTETPSSTPAPSDYYYYNYYYSNSSYGDDDVCPRTCDGYSCDEVILLSGFSFCVPEDNDLYLSCADVEQSLGCACPPGCCDNTTCPSNYVAPTIAPSPYYFDDDFTLLRSPSRAPFTPTLAPSNSTSTLAPSDWTPSTWSCAYATIEGSITLDGDGSQDVEASLDVIVDAIASVAEVARLDVMVSVTEGRRRLLSGFALYYMIVTATVEAADRVYICMDTMTPADFDNALADQGDWPFVNSVTTTSVGPPELVLSDNKSSSSKSSRVPTSLLVAASIGCAVLLAIIAGFYGLLARLQRRRRTQPLSALSFSMGGTSRRSSVYHNLTTDDGLVTPGTIELGSSSTAIELGSSPSSSHNTQQVPDNEVINPVIDVAATETTHTPDASFV